MRISLGIWRRCESAGIYQVASAGAYQQLGGGRKTFFYFGVYMCHELIVMLSSSMEFFDVVVDSIMFAM